VIGGAPATGAVTRILEERARALARPLHVEPSGGTVDLVVLSVGTQRYGLDAGRVVEIQQLTGLARVPGLPPVWAGIVNLRGTLYAVLDLRRCLGLQEPATPTGSGPAGPATVAVVAGAGLTVGLLVDGATEIARVPADRIGPPLLGAPALIRGMTPDLLTVLDVEDLLAGSVAMGVGA
jgi:purine-binding chemotaxis protein CheW